MSKSSFAPIVDSESQVLILGTMPGDESLRTRQYYANPKNQFWGLVSSNDNLEPLSYQAKCKYLLDNKIAIWDVLSEAEREGSLDANISDDKPNDFSSLLRKYPSISHIFFNGTKAEKLFKKHFPNYIGQYACQTLSSSSPTPGKNVKTVEEKKKQWKDALSFLNE